MMTKPSKVHLHKQSKVMEILLAGQAYSLSAEFLRVHSPSAEVRGHGPDQGKLIDGKIDVGISDIKPTGNYGLTLIFDDGHDSGIFSWRYLVELCQNQKTLWQCYLDKLHQQKKSREPHTKVIQFSP